MEIEEIMAQLAALLNEEKIFFLLLNMHIYVVCVAELKG